IVAFSCTTSTYADPLAISLQNSHPLPFGSPPPRGYNDHKDARQPRPPMATEARTKTSRNEALIPGHLARVDQRIRRVDVAAGLLCLLAMTLFWFVLSAAIHRWLDLSSSVRILNLFACASAIGYALYLLVYRPWRRPLNPLYSAHLLERQLPDAHNSVASFVD